METNDINIQDENIQAINQPQKKVPYGMIAVSVLLAAVLVFMVIAYFNQKNNMVEMEVILTEEKDSLANELRKLSYGYDTLKTNNDTLNANLEREQARIEEILKINASNAQLIRTYRNEISTMREIMKSYIVQIDSLNTHNQQLVAENTQYRAEISRIQNDNSQLERVREQLNAQVEIASVIQIKDIVPVALNKKRKETEKLNALENLRVCFTLRENALAEAGEKEIFLRVIRPDGLVVSSSSDNVFLSNEHGELIYSASRIAEYINQDIEVCIYVNNKSDFIAGNYTVELFLEGNLMGSSSFLLK